MNRKTSPNNIIFCSLIYTGNILFSNLALISILIFVTPFTNGENLFFNFNHTIVAAVVISLLIIINFNKIIHHKRILSRYFTIFLFMLVLSYFLSTIFGLQYSDNPSLTRYNTTFFSTIRSLFLLLPLHIAIIYVIYLSIDSFSDLKNILIVFLICSLFVNIITVYLLSTGVNTIAGRLASTYEDPNYLGRLEVISVVLSFCLILFNDLPSNIKLLNIFNIVFSVIIQILTFSRSSIITLVVTIFIILYFSKNKFIKFLIPSILVVGMIVIIPIMSSVRYGLGGSDNISFLGTFVDPSNAFRLYVNFIGLKMFADNPLFGVGYNNFYNTMVNNSNYFPVSLPLITNTPIIHSWFFSILAEQGLFGFFSFLSLLIFTFKRLIMIVKMNINNEVLYIGVSIISIFIVIIFNGLFFPTILLELLFSIVCGCVGAYLKIVKINYSDIYPKLQSL